MSRTGKYVETEGRLVVDSGGAGGGGRETRNDYLRGTGFLFWIMRMFWN